MQEPTTIELGTDLVPLQRDKRHQLVENKQQQTFQYVPLLDGLNSLLSKEKILHEVS